MGLFGRILSGAANWARTGPLGDVIDALGEDEEGGSSPRPGRGERYPRARPEDSQQLFLVAVISLLAKLAKADGRVSKQEISTVDEFFKERLGLKGSDRKKAIRLFQEAKRSRDGFEDFALQVWDASGRKKGLAREILNTLLRVAAADGALHPEERTILVRAARIFDLGEAEYEQLEALHHKDLSGSYEVLGVGPKASDREVRKAYGKLVKQYHPDRIASKDLPPAFQEFAERQFRKIQVAYDEVREARGF